MNYAGIIKQRVTMIDIVNKYGLETDRKGVMLCPFHNEKTPSMKIYEGDRGCYCFGCGYSADVIGFVKDYFKLSFIETLKKIDVDFGLCLYTSTSFEDVRKAHYKAKIEVEKREQAKRKKEKNEAEYWETFEEWERLKENKKKYAPKTQTEDLHPLFIEAVQKLPQQEYILDILSSRRCENV